MSHPEQMFSSTENPQHSSEKSEEDIFENIQEDRVALEAESVQLQEAAEREAVLISERIKQLPETSLEGSETSEESFAEHKDGELKGIHRALDDLFSVAERRSPSKHTLGEQMQMLARAPKDFFVETRALSSLRQSKGELEKALASQEERGEAMRALSRIINGMGDNENIKTFHSHNAGIEKKLLALGTEILLDNQDIFLESLNDPDPVTEEVIGRILSGTVIHQYESSSRPSGTDREIETLSVRLLPSIQKRIEALKKGSQGKGDIFEHYAIALRPATLQGDQEKASAAQQVWSEAFLAGKNPEILKAIVESYVYDYSLQGRGQKTEMFSHLVARMGLDPEKFYDADKNKKGYGKENYIKNILAAQALESSLPGSVKSLAEEYGIQSFARYPKEILLRQLEAEENLESSYGIVLNPREDWNGGFYGDQRVFSELANSAQDEKMNVRIFECESKMDAVKKLIRLHRKYGAEGKIQFAIVGGHGNNELLEFGQEERKTLKKKDLEGNAMQELRSFFDEDATIVLNSCSTGDDFGLGETLSRLAKIKVIAADSPTRLRSLRVTSGGAVVAEYKKDADKEKSPLRVYAGGRLEVGERSEKAKEIEELVNESF